VVAYLGDLAEEKRGALLDGASHAPALEQLSLFEGLRPPNERPEWTTIDTRAVRVEHPRSFGLPWIAIWLIRHLGLDQFFTETLPVGKEEIPWAAMAQILIVARFCEPSSDLAVAERWYPRSALPELLGVPGDKVNDDRVYRALDRLLGAKAALTQHLRARMGELFDLEYDLLLYDVTSTYFEGQAKRNPQARRGYSRDQRPDCKQVCIALVVSRDGTPIDYEVFDGNRNDVTTVEEIVTVVEARHGRADRIWVMDRGMVSEEILQFLRDGERRYIVGTPKSQLRRWQMELAGDGWSQVHEGLEVKVCPGPDGAETFILCRSDARREKERAMLERAASQFETGLQELLEASRKREIPAGKLHERIGRLRERYSRASRLFETEVTPAEGGEGATLSWQRREGWTEWADLSEGCYVLRSNISDWTGEELWKAYIQLTQAEAAFRIQKQDLGLRPVWHQTAERVQAHILVCFLAYVLWHAMGRKCRAAGLGDCPRRVLEELGEIRMVDVVMPTRGGIVLRKRCVTTPEKPQAVLLQRLKISLPRSLSYHWESGDVV
jgi:transposase